MADAAGLGPAGRKAMGVRLPPSAPTHANSQSNRFSNCGAQSTGDIGEVKTLAAEACLFEIRVRMNTIKYPFTRFRRGANLCHTLFLRPAFVPHKLCLSSLPFPIASPAKGGSAWESEPM
jgi:hypothetical protein